MMKTKKHIYLVLHQIHEGQDVLHLLDAGVHRRRRKGRRRPSQKESLHHLLRGDHHLPSLKESLHHLLRKGLHLPSLKESLHRHPRRDHPPLLNVKNHRRRPRSLLLPLPKITHHLLKKTMENVPKLYLAVKCANLAIC
jgi:hypothetical protein